MALLVRPYRFATAGLIALALFIAGLGACEPLLLKVLFDNFHPGGAVRILVLGVAALVGLLLVREGAGALSQWLTWRTRLGMQHAFLEATVDRLHVLPLSFHQEQGVGATMTRVDRGIQGLAAAVTDISMNALPSAVYLIIAAAVMIELEPRLALVVLLFAPLPALLTAFTAPTQVRRERRLLERWTRIYSRFNEVLSGIVTVKSFAMEDHEQRRFLGAVTDANGLVLRGVRFDTGIGALQNVTIAAARVAAITYGGALALEGEITLGTLIAFLGYVAGVFGPVQGLSSLYRTFRTAAVSLEAVCSVLDADETLDDAPDACEVTTVNGDVRFDEVQFSSRPGGRLVLAGIDLTVRAGETVAVVGPSGSGKSTMMALLQRFYDPTSGSVAVDGMDLRTLKQRSLRRHIGVVIQDSLLFDDTIAANIAYGRPGATMEEIVAAAQTAHAHQFISLLPDGYRTLAGERGKRLSAGERQRIAIARVVLKDPAILVLDEPTSALDAESEALVQDAMEHLIRRRTTFIIAHRLSTVVNADRVLVLRDGRIAESGTHRELVARDGYYALLVRHQTHGLLPGLVEARTSRAVGGGEMDQAPSP